MQDENSLQYLLTLKEQSRNRYQGKPYKPRGPEATQSQKTQTLYDALMELYIDASRRVTAKGKRPPASIEGAGGELAESFKICRLGWSSLDDFKKALDKWEQAMQGYDENIVQERINFDL